MDIFSSRLILQKAIRDVLIFIHATTLFLRCTVYPPMGHCRAQISDSAMPNF